LSFKKCFFPMQKKIIRKISKSNGFTLIELLIVVVTMTLLFGVGFANYRDFQKREYLKTADRLIKADLRLAQEMAISGRKPQEFPGNACETQILQGYRFELDTDNYPGGRDSYQIDAFCGPTLGTATRVFLKAVNLPEGIDMSSIGGSVFTFKVLARGVDIPGAQIGITLNFPGSGVPGITVTVRRSGEIL